MCGNLGALCKDSNNVTLSNLSSEMDCERGTCHFTQGGSVVPNSSGWGQYTCENSKVCMKNGNQLPGYCDNYSHNDFNKCGQAGGTWYPNWWGGKCILDSYNTQASCQGGGSGNYWTSSLSEEACNFLSPVTGGVSNYVSANYYHEPSTNTWVTPYTWKKMGCSGTDNNGNQQICLNKYSSESLNNNRHLCLFPNNLKIAKYCNITDSATICTDTYVQTMFAAPNCSEFTDYCKDSNNVPWTNDGQVVALKSGGSCPTGYTKTSITSGTANIGDEPKICQSTDGSNNSFCDPDSTADCTSGLECVGSNRYDEGHTGGFCSDMGAGSACHDSSKWTMSPEPSCSAGYTCNDASGSSGPSRTCQ
jgi:hypothetical protein